jgi:cytochrome c556
MGMKHFLFVVSAFLAIAPSLQAEEPATGLSGYSMSPGLLELFRAEMRELLAGSQAIAAALPVADWTSISATSEQMQKSYVLERQLTDAQRDELESLPAQFKALDEQFHRGTEKLAHAASQQDAQLVAFYFARLLEECTQCHATYAQTRFPGFPQESVDAHHH